MNPAKIISAITLIGVVLILFAFLIADARRHEIERDAEHFHIRYGVRERCVEPNCPRDE